MLLKYSQAQKQRMKLTGSGKPQRATGMMKLSTPSLVSVMPRVHRKVIKAASKRPIYSSSSVSTASSAAHHHGHHHHHRALSSTKCEERVPVDPCDNSNDSGLGFDHFDYPLVSQPTSLHFSDKEASWPEELPEVKRRRLEIKLESDDANDNFTFPESVTHNPRTLCMPVSRINREKISPPVAPCAPLTLTSQLNSISRDGRIQLQILCQPEQQHRARYQTEGSRGAVKDRTGNGFPVVKLVGYTKTTSLQVFIGTDQGKVAPHMFYQACRVSGKNSTPCTERKVDGTMVIEVDAEPSKDMIVTCDCVGILKERNVDVEHRFPEESSARSKKKSTRCRMVFRTTITHTNGSTETLQVTSQPIVCTQPPGVPEICKKSLTSCPAAGGVELFILGKNFLKDTRVVFQEAECSTSTWKQTVQPDKEFLQQSHLVCTVPPYQCQDIKEPVNVRLCVESSGKCSEPHMFLYTPNPAATPTPETKSSATAVSAALPSDGHIVGPGLSPKGSLVVGNMYPPPGITAAHSVPIPTQLIMPAEAVAATTTTTFITTPPETARTEEKVHPMMLWQTSVSPMEKPMEMIPPDLLPIAVRRPSLQMIVPETLAPEELKREVTDSPAVTIESLPPLATVADLSSTQSPSMDTLRRFVSPDQNAPLPSLSLDNYLTNLENATSAETLKQQHQLINEVPQILVPTVVTTATPPSGKTIFVDNTTVLENQLLSHNETSRVVIETANPIQYTAATISSTANCNQESLGVIVTSSSTIPEVETLTLEQTQTPQIDDLVSPSMVRRTSTTDRLDAFVNSAAESHISPGASSSIMMPPPPPPDSSVLQTIAAVQSSSIDTSQTPNQTLSDTSLCSLLSRSLQDQPATQVTPSLGTLSLPHHLSTQSAITNATQFEDEQQKFSNQEVISTRQESMVERKETEQFVIPMPQVTQDTVIVTAALAKQPQFELKPIVVQKVAQVTVKKCEEGIPLPHELTQMSENDLLSYINPSCFDQV